MAQPAKRVRRVLTASGSSRNHAQAARTSDGLVVFAAGHSIALWNSADEHHSGVHRTLPGHQGDVTALDFAHDGAGDGTRTSRFFVSGDAKGVTRVWKESEGEWTTLAILSGHTGSVASVEALEVESDASEVELLVLTGGSDSVVQVWRVSAAGEVELLQKLELKGKIPLEMALSYLPASSSLALAIGGTETRIQLYTSSSATQPQFSKSLSLEGHSDWVRTLSFVTPIPTPGPPAASTSTAASSLAYDVSPGEVLLASGSQDNYIRLWRFSRVPISSSSAVADSSSATVGPSSSTATLDPLDELDRTLAEAEAALGGGGEEELRVKAHDFTVPAADGSETVTFSCASEAVLLGHDAWVTGLNWAPLSSTSPPSLRLLSTSADRSLILWEPLPSEPSTSSSSAATPSYTKTSPTSSSASYLWTSTQRFGEFASQTNLGFFGALWGLEGRTVLASGWGGSWHVWTLSPSLSSSSSAAAGEGDEGEWEPQVAVSGHLGAVRQVQWEPMGEYLLSCAADMSTRLWAPWRREGGVETWHELARPQIHGYPLSSLSFTPRQNRLQFVSGADEKVVRVFDAPGVFLRSLRTLSGVETGKGEEGRPMAANVPPLGLSNRAMASTEEADQLAPASNDPFEAVTAVNFEVAPHPPLEEQLLGSTLWPETEKLYGHAFELVSVGSAHSAPLIATACKATLPEHAVIRLFSTDTWRAVGDVLVGHSLTITKLAFSPGTEGEGEGGRRDRWLLSVGRDRTWRIYGREEEKGLGFYRPFADAPKAHARIVWDACWAADASFFATASRDKTVKLWAPTPSTSGDGATSFPCIATLKFAEAATSVAATQLDGAHVLAVGLENGEVRVFVAQKGGEADWEEKVVLDSSLAHVLAVTTLSFCPPVKQLSPGIVRLASGSEDHSVRVYDVEVQ
ncbi:hypothetical protein JCM8097_007000 [Rhodosporidiobolus ruineniae]